MTITGPAGRGDDYRVPEIERQRWWHELTVDQAGELIRSHAWRSTRNGLECAKCGITPSHALVGCIEDEEVTARRRAELTEADRAWLRRNGTWPPNQRRPA